MMLKKHIDFKCRPVSVFLLLFLNCLLAAAPFITDFSTDNNRTYLSQYHLNYSGAEDSNHLSETAEGQAGYSSSLYKKQQVSRFVNRAGQYTFFSAASDDSALGLSFVSSSFIVRPAYYTLLFLYNLF